MNTTSVRAVGAAAGATLLALISGSATVPAAVASDATQAPAAAHARCSAFLAPGRVQLRKGQTRASARTASAILTDTVHCRAASLVRRATKDKTQVSFGEISYKEFFSTPDSDHKYRDLARALTRTSAAYNKEQRITVWPAVEQHPENLALWRQAIRAGLFPQKEFDAMRRANPDPRTWMYYGYRVQIDDKGHWTAFIAGD